MRRNFLWKHMIVVCMGGMFLTNGLCMAASRVGPVIGAGDDESQRRTVTDRPSKGSIFATAAMVFGALLFTSGLSPVASFPISRPFSGDKMLLDQDASLKPSSFLKNFKRASAESRLLPPPGKAVLENFFPSTASRKDPMQTFEKLKREKRRSHGRGGRKGGRTGKNSGHHHNRHAGHGGGSKTHTSKKAKNQGHFWGGNWWSTFLPLAVAFYQTRR